MSMFWCKYPMTNFMLRKRYFQSLIDVSNTVQEALFTKKPVVALETAVISHGMPYPYNKEVAIAVEEIVKQQGAVPATIGVVNGRIKVGMNAEIISLLARPETKKVKISRRDVPVVLSQGLTGGTTVSGTLLVAKMIGINVFVTGGIGGVHRDVTDSMDVSADLIELSNSPVLAVCSGVKSILDISRTLEYLETFGVCVVTYGETKEFPAFYSQKSGSQCVYNVTNPEAAADLIFNSRKLNLNTAVVLGVPIPEEFAIDDKIMQTIIKEALVLSKERGIHGKYLTPFLLERINCITKGKSLESNIALIKNNAVIGGQIAVQLSEKSSKER